MGHLVTDLTERFVYLAYPLCTYSSSVHRVEPKFNRAEPPTNRAGTDSPYALSPVFYFFRARTGRKKTKILGVYYIFSCVKCVKIQSAWSPFGLTGDWMK